MSQRDVSARLGLLMPVHVVEPPSRADIYYSWRPPTLTTHSQYGFLDKSLEKKMKILLLGHPGPLHAVGHVLYENGVHVSLAFGTEFGQMVSDDPGVYGHKRVFVIGTKGFVHWRFNSWERSTLSGGYESGPINYGEQDVVAQANFTEAIFDWLDDETNVHPTHLRQSLVESNLILGLYYSGLTNEIIELPFEPP